MTIQSLPLSSILPPDGNPRTGIDQAGIESLAASILADGVLQNLVAVPLAGEELHYRLISGERRYQALQWLLERGQIAADHAVPTDVRTGLTEEDTLRLALVENLQRENLPPLDEAHAFATLLQHGTAIEDVSAQTGVSASTIKRRLALVNLCDEAQQALADSEIGLAQAEALTLGSHDAQRHLLEQMAAGAYYDAEDIRSILLSQKPSAAMALFPLDHYTGTFTSDLFGEKATTYFDDIEQFFTRQRQAVETLAERHRATADWVEVTEQHAIPRWHYRPADDGEARGVLINLSPTGEVEVLEDLARRDIHTHTATATTGTALAPKPKPAYSEVLCRYIAHHKSMAVQHLLFNHPRKAKEVAVLLLMGASDYERPRVCVSRHDCLRTFAGAESPPASYQAVEQHAQRLATALGLSEDDEDSTGWERLLSPSMDVSALYDAVKALSDEDLDDLHVLLTVLCFGQGNSSRLDLDDTLFNRVARDLGVDMRQFWRPDADFLSRRTRLQLLEVAVQSGYAARGGSPASLKKSELVTALTGHFVWAHHPNNMAETAKQGRDWLPAAMRFPAVDPATEGTVSEEAHGEAPAAEALAA